MGELVNLGAQRIRRDLAAALPKMLAQLERAYEPAPVILHPRDYADRAAVHRPWCASWIYPGPLAVADASCSCVAVHAAGCASLSFTGEPALADALCSCGASPPAP